MWGLLPGGKPPLSWPSGPVETSAKTKCIQHFDYNQNELLSWAMFFPKTEKSPGCVWSPRCGWVLGAEWELWAHLHQQPGIFPVLVQARLPAAHWWTHLRWSVALWCSSTPPRCLPRRFSRLSGLICVHAAEKPNTVHVISQSVSCVRVFVCLRTQTLMNVSCRMVAALTSAATLLEDTPAIALFLCCWTSTTSPAPVRMLLQKWHCFILIELSYVRVFFCFHFLFPL